MIAAGLLAYFNSFTGAFVFDDHLSIEENPTIRQLWPIWPALSPPRMGGITVESRPLVNLSLAVNYAFGGTEVWGYHALNLIIHVLAGVTLLGVVRRTLRQPRLRERYGAAADELALAVAILWMVHPLQTESVTYVVQRAESLMGLFYLLTLYCFIRGTESPRPGTWYGLSVVACAAGMVSKEVMVSAPVMILLYDRTFVAGSLREAWWRRRLPYLALAGTLILLIVMLKQSFSNELSSIKANRLTPCGYILTEPGVILHYLRLSVWPHPLCFDYYGWPTAWTWTNIVGSTLALVVLLAPTAWACKRNSVLGFLGLWFLFILAPTSSFFPTDSPAYEHRMYLPLAAVVVVAVVGIHALTGGRSVWVFAAIAIAFGILTARRNRDYQSEFAMWNDTVLKCPNNARAHYNLGVTLQRAGETENAIRCWEDALRIKPEYADAHNNLGLALLQEGKTTDAIRHLQQALQIEPMSFAALCNFGAAVLQAGRTQEAIGYLQRAVQINPNSALAQYRLGNAMLQSGKAGDAIRQYYQALRIHPNYIEAQNNLAWVLATRTPAEGGDPARAVTLAQRACDATAHHAPAYLDTLAMAYAATGRFQEAIATAETALELTRQAGPRQLESQIQSRLDSYRRGRAWRETDAN